MRLIALLLMLVLPAATLAEDRGPGGPYRYLGHGRLVVNDVFGDRYDRWRTGSVVGSYVFGPDWTGQLPVTAGELLEFRIMAEVIAPIRLDLPYAGDRPYVGAWSLGLHTHFERAGWQMALGADAVITGPQTGLSDIQAFLHDITFFDHEASPQVLAGQVGNGIHAAGVIEAAREYALGPAVLRPFAEIRTGVENMARLGFDLSTGPAGRGELLVRDPVTGHRYRVLDGAGNGWSFVVGADVAKVWDSLYLPATTNRLTDFRTRARAGVHWQVDRFRGFYGLTWLGPEFQGQREGQFVGALRIDFRF